MKKAHIGRTDTSNFAPSTATNSNVMEGAPAGMPVPKASVGSISDRPHILAKRNSRANRRAAH